MTSCSRILNNFSNCRWYLCSQVKKYGPVPAGKHRKSLEHGSSIPTGNFRIFSDDFRPVPAGKHRKLTGIHRKKIRKFPVGILLPCSGDFRCFPAGSGDFPASFLQDPAGSGGRNLRPGVYVSISYWYKALSCMRHLHNPLRFGFRTIRRPDSFQFSGSKDTNYFFERQGSNVC